LGSTDLKKRLTAILAADVAGYSRLMAMDDRGTVIALDSARKVFKANIESNQGRVIDMAGDSVLAAFETASGAVSSAMAIQAELITLGGSVPEDRRMRFRVGIHLGDVIEKDDGTVYGDGVNIAARLEGLAEPGGITVSDSIRNAVKGKVSAEFEDQGEQKVKNIPEPVRAYRVRATATAENSPPAPSGIDPSLPEKPSIAVLPFKVLSEDSRMAFLAEGLVEDVGALLARIAGFVVISHASSSAFHNTSMTVSDISRQLGVRYVVIGSVRPLELGVRISAQLTEGMSGRVLWSGQFEKQRESAIDLQDDITRGILSELEPELTRAEIASIKRLRPENVDAWGNYRQALGAMSLKGWTEEAMSEARAHFRRAFEIDPSFALARAHFALVTALGRNTGLISADIQFAEEARAAAEEAISLDDGSSQVLGYAGCALSDLGDHKRGSEILLRSLELDPSNAQSYVALGASQCLRGEFKEGIERMRYGMRISPRDRRLGFWGWVLGAFLLQAGLHEDALIESRQSVARDPRLYLARILEAAALQTLGRPEEGREALNTARRLRPSLTIEEIVQSHGHRIAKLIRPLWDGSSTN
jgi:adenylate cyclase